MKPVTNVAFIVQGNMGWPIAARLAEAGFKLMVFGLNKNSKRLKIVKMISG